MVSGSRLIAIDAVIRSIRTGEHSAALRAEKFLANEIRMNANGIEIEDRDAVIDHLSGQWAFTPVLARGEWSLPQPSKDDVSVSAEFPGLGAAPSNYRLTFWFNDRDLISRIEEKYSFATTAEPVDHIPAHIRTAINGALANQTPMVLAYVDDNERAFAVAARKRSGLQSDPALPMGPQRQQRIDSFDSRKTAVVAAL